MQRKQLSKKEIKEINEKINRFGLEIDKKSNVELVDDKILFVNSKSLYFYYKGIVYPTLKILQKQNTLKKVTVDMGAVKFVVNGADIMRPGIIAVDEYIKKDEIVAIVDENNSKPIAIGIALYPRAEILEQNSGKVVKNLHWVGDEVWGY